MLHDPLGCILRQLVSLDHCVSVGIQTIDCQFPLIPSQLTNLILDGCLAMTALPEGLGIKLSNLAELGLAYCSELAGLPPWVSEIEKLGAGVVRPAHLA